MKKIAISIILLNFLIIPLLGDHLPSKHHIIKRTTIIENVNNFSGYTLIGIIRGRVNGSVGYKIQVIKQNKPLFKGYKLNAYYIMALPNEVLKKMGGIEKIDAKTLFSYEPARIRLLADPHSVEDSNPLNSERITYTIHSIKNGKIIMYVSKRILGFNNSLIPNIIENYSYSPE